MKKLLLAGFLAFMVSCKTELKTETAVDVTDTVNAETDTAVAAPDCATNPIITELRSASNSRIDWIKKNGQLICNNGLEECILEFHVIGKERFDQAVAAHPDNKPSIKEYSLTWGEIMSKIQNSGAICYSKHITFTFSGSAIDLKFADFSVSDTTSFYSIPLFKGIATKYGIPNNETVYFYKALIEEKTAAGNKPMERVVFKVKNNYFNISSDPAE